MSTLNFNVAGDAGNDQPVLIADNPPGGTTLETHFEGVPGHPPNRFIATVPPEITGGATLYYQHRTKSVRVIVPPGAGSWEAGAPPCLPPELQPEDMAMKYGPALPAHRQPQGVMTLVRKAWTDAGGPFYPLEFSLFSAPRFFAMGDLDYIDRHGEFMSGYGFNGVRIFYAWNRSPAETQDALAGTIDRFYDRWGIRSFVTAQAAPHNKTGERACEEVLEVVMKRRHKVLGLEGTNERWASEDEAVSYAKILKRAGLPTAVGYGDAGLAKVEELTKRAGVDVVCLHLERGGDEARQTRQCWDFHDLPVAARNGEPGGPGSSVSAITAPDVLAKIRAFGIICGAGDFVFHWGGGVFGDGVPHANGPRPKYIMDVDNIGAQLRAVANAHKCLPTGMENWAHFHGGTILKLTRGSLEKQYAARHGNEMVQAITDARGVLDFVATDGHQWDWQLFDPSTGEKAENGSLDGYILKAVQR